MELKCWINGKAVTAEISPDMALLEFVRSQGYLSVKRGCETSNCGLCTVWMENKPVLSCSVPAPRAQGKHIVTLEGLQEEAKEFADFMANEGADQCGYCNSGFVMNVLAMDRELKDPTDDEVLEYLSGNLCRCTGYASQMRAIKKYLKRERRS